MTTIPFGAGRLAAFALVASACTGDGGPTPSARTVTLTDEAIQPVATLDGVTRVVDLEATADGRVWVLNSTEPFFTVVAADGAIERAFGRQGGGPGEFDNPVTLVRGTGADEVWSYDWTRNALIRLTGGDAVQHPLPDSFPRPSLVSFKGAGINPAPPWIRHTDEGFLFARARDVHAESALHLWDADLFVVSERDGREPTVDLPVADLLGDPSSRFGAASILIPYPLWAACPDGTRALYDPLANALRLFSAEGAEGSPRKLPDEPGYAMTADLVFEMFFRQLAADRPASQLPDMEQMRALTRDQNEGFVSGSAPDFPEYAELECTRDGTLWLRRFDPAAGRLGLGHAWVGIGSDGVRVEIEVPRSFTTHRVTAERFWGVMRDSLGVETLSWIEMPWGP